MQSRSRTTAAPALDLPPPFRLVTLREVGDAFAHAKAIAAEAGAGTLVHVGRFDLVGIRRRARAGRAAADRAAGVLRRHGGAARRAAGACPAGAADHLRWPDAIHVDGGLIGGGRLAWPAGCSRDRAARMAGVRRQHPHRVAWARRRPACARSSTALDEEGFDDLGSGRLVESFARHLMVAIDAWRANEFATVTQDISCIT